MNLQQIHSTFMTAQRIEAQDTHCIGLNEGRGIFDAYPENKSIGYCKGLKLCGGRRAQDK